MSATYVSAQEAMNTLFEFFSDYWATSIDLKEVRELQDCLTVINFYSETKRRQLLDRLLAGA